MTLHFSIQRLSSTFNTSQFDCGNHSLNDYLQKHAYSNANLGIGQAWAALLSGSSKVVGYYVSCATSVASKQSLPRQLAGPLPGYPIPSALLAKLAVDKSVQKSGVGKMLLMHCLSGIKAVSNTMGIYLVVVDAIDESAKAYYCQFGFVPLLDDTNRLVYPVSSIP